MLHTSSPAGGSVLALNASLEIAFNSLPLPRAGLPLRLASALPLSRDLRQEIATHHLQFLQHSREVALAYRHAGLFSPQHEQISQLIVCGPWHFSSPMPERLKPWWHDC
jgi:hypothetical protein